MGSMASVTAARALALVLLLPAPGMAGLATAQELPDPPPPAGPEVTFPDATVPGLLRPLSGGHVVPLEAQVGCDGLEAVGGTTVGRLRVVAQPPWLNAIVPSETVVPRAPGACPLAGAQVIEPTLELALTQNAPAYEPAVLQVEMIVEKRPPEGPPRTYGPYVANVTFTPGFFNLFDVKTERKVQSAEPGEPAVYPIVIENFSNGETRFVLAPQGPLPEDVQATVEPSELSLGFGRIGRAELVVEHTGLEPLGRATAQVAVTIDSFPANPAAKQVSNGTEARTTTQFQGLADRATPGPSSALVALAVGLAAAFGMRARWR